MRVPPAQPQYPAESASVRAAFGTIARRLLPLIFACYIVAYLDRVNVGFAKLQMAAALGLSDVVYGFGAGIFFIGYFCFEVPSNLLLERIGARIWIARIMITWGLVSGAFAFVNDIPWGPLPALFGLGRAEFSFYALRFLLGVAEAGFFPGIILYLTYWFPSARRARAVAVFMTAIAVANVVGAPVSGAIMQYFDGAGGWPGWRWLFLLEAIPSLIAGALVIWLLPDGPASAQWLTQAERDEVVAYLASDRAVVSTRAGTEGARMAGGRTNGVPFETLQVDGAVRGVCAALFSIRVWAMAFVYLAGTFALYGVNFWMPTLVQELGIDGTDYLRIGVITMIPWGVAGVVMVLAGAHSDRTGERRWHVAGALLATAFGLCMLAAVGHMTVLSVIALTIITSGVLAFFATFWSIPTGFLQASGAAAGIAWINSVGNLGGYFGPDLIGRVRAASGSAAGAFIALAVISVVGAVILLVFTRTARANAGLASLPARSADAAARARGTAGS